MTSRLALVAAAALSAACATLGGLTYMDEMSEAAFEAYRARVAAQVSFVVDASLAEGDLDQGDVAELAGALRAVADGVIPPAAGGLVAQLSFTSAYAEVAVVLAIGELDGQLANAGAYEDGLISARGAEVLRSIAAALESKVE